MFDTQNNMEINIIISHIIAFMGGYAFCCAIVWSKLAKTKT